MGSRPKKKWGQNFLRNAGAADHIVEAVEPLPDEVILEIGPGEGVLTHRLVRLPNPVIALEIDPELTEELRARYGDRVELRNEDAVEAPLPTIPFRAVGNLPYNAGTPILRRVIADPNCRRAVFMLQKEVAQRLAAKPNDEQYGYLTLYTRLFATARVIMTLGPKSFHPPPKVHSAVVVLDPSPPSFVSDRETLLDLISTAFRMRRKKLTNNLDGWRSLSRAAVQEAIAAAGLSADVRSEQMSLADFDRLCEELLARLRSGSK